MLSPMSLPSLASHLVSTLAPLACLPFLLPLDLLLTTSLPPLPVTLSPPRLSSPVLSLTRFPPPRTSALLALSL
ncbi:hypothetical protein BDV25DRAFT_155310 [Aspergillus avenaceus]|uniref:Uncharacterized protein n=1 Tax=Aspergillus avenaceus TaxID=36643 RepID=A0A5N6TUI9_ASPAV|nr:hypothetical protein BDV25DRAFT_155310 [Aspergillus avenaceus]